MVLSALDKTRPAQRGVALFDADDKRALQICGPDDFGELLRLAIQVGGIGIFETDFDRDRSRFSPELCAILGLPVGAEMTYNQAVLLYHGPDRAAAIARAEGALYASERGRRSSVHRIMRPDGTVRWISVQGRRIYRDAPEGPQPVRSIGTVTDITELKRLEQEAKDLSERLINLQEEERQQIAQELHDSTAQHLVAVDLNLGSLRPQVELSAEESRRWDETEAILQEAMKEIRTFSYLMHPPSLQAAGLNSTIQDYVAGFSNRTKIDARVRLNPKLDRLPFEMQRTFLRIVQEALTNVHRHAGASNVIIDLRWITDRVHLIVRDNGRGSERTNEQAAFGSGRGVSGMSVRAHQFGGALRMRTGSQGTTIHVAVPAQLTAVWNMRARPWQCPSQPIRRHRVNTD